MDHKWQHKNVSLDQMSEVMVQAFPALDPQEQRAGIVLYRLLAGGNPIALPELTQALQWTGVPAGQFLSTSNLRNLVEWGTNQTVIGFGGLTSRNSRHSLVFNDRRLCTWRQLGLHICDLAPQFVVDAGEVLGPVFVLELDLDI